MYNISSDKTKIYRLLMNITLLFVCVQPIFDILSFLYMRGYIPVGISTYGKPVIIGIINIILLLIYRKHIRKCAVTYSCFIVLTVGHVLLMNAMRVDMSVILHEVRFMLNLLYMLICYFSLRILYEEAEDKALFVKYLKKTLLMTFGVYIVFYFMALLSGTSAKTYEYSDPLKRGFKGWMDSGQIFGHSLSMCLPLIIAYLFNNNAYKKSVRILLKLLVAVPVAVLCLIGTKVTYFMAVIVLFAQVVLELFFAIKDKEKSHYLNSLICIVFAFVCIFVYPITPVKHNIDINNSVISVQLNEEEVTSILEKEKDKLMPNKKEEDKEEENQQGGTKPSTKPQVNEYTKNNEWTSKTFDLLQQKYMSGELHPSDLRAKQLVFNLEKYKLADFKYKLFGIGYLNQQEMAIERDVLCILFSFGILGAALFLLRPLLLWIKSAYLILKNLLKNDIYTLCLFEGISIFFFISWFAGYTFIYTNFSIYLCVIMVLLNHSVKELQKDKGLK